ncbi:F-box/LRR-repeat protein 7-like [Uranotaenia lowii]|uniref:F-box/LRR-repeat protein 7-like n=1 Tax=Uranotaenia lowii TaxID=190385 RepID=UPI0024789AE7|nr:F-box/LRR-repeat protein 7-like [Uranotaenia lowii]
MSFRDDLYYLLEKMNFTMLSDLQLQSHKLNRHVIFEIYKKCPRLKRLALCATSLLNCDSVLGKIAVNLNQLRELALECSTRTSFLPLMASLNYLNNLTTLSIHRCENITDESISFLNIPFLTRLQIVQNRKISKVGLNDLFCHCIRLKDLTIRECIGVDDDAVDTICTCLPLLEKLDLSSSPTITLNSIRYIMNGLKYLKSLRLEDCQRILVQWRSAPRYLCSLYALKSFYRAYPEFFYYNLPIEENDRYSDDYYYYYDSSSSYASTDGEDEFEDSSKLGN